MEFHAGVRLAESLSDSLPPLAVDIDGTLTDESRVVDPRVFPVLQAWPSTLVIATGKAVPYPVSLCEFLGVEPRVVAENGGVVVPSRTSGLLFRGDREAAMTVAEEYRSRGYTLGWGESDLVNRWRETELAVSRESPLEPLEEIASKYGLTVVDTGFAYHVHSADVDKGVGLATLADELGLDAGTFAYIGDSENDSPAFEIAEVGIAVDNAPEPVKARADYVTKARYADGFLEAVEYLQADTG